jgi:hypothetical protein
LGLPPLRGWRNWPQWRGPESNGLVLQGRPPLTSLVHHAFDRKTGKELWKKPRRKFSWTTPYILERDGKTQVIVNGARSRAPRPANRITRKNGWKESPASMPRLSV